MEKRRVRPALLFCHGLYTLAGYMMKQKPLIESGMSKWVLRKLTLYANTASTA